ncbi:unnamed protein product [Cochlearia groenlandica]
MNSLILHRRNSLKLHDLRASLNLLQIIFTSAFSSAIDSHISTKDVRKSKPFDTVSYLVESLSLSPKIAESISKKVTFDDKHNPDSVLSLLRSHGFTDSQISTVITTYPGCLNLNAEESIGPKLEFLKSRGASSTEIAEVVSTVPKILSKKGDKTISVYYDYIKDIVAESDDDDDDDDDDKCCNYEEMSCVSPSSSLLKGNLENKMRNVLVLRRLGVPRRLLFPLVISNYQPVCGKERFELSLKRVLENGFDPKTSKFVQALHVLYQNSDETLQKKVETYKSLGFESSDDVWEIFKKWPFALKFSGEKITRTFETLKSCGLLEEEVLSLLKKSPQFLRVSQENIAKSIETFLGLGFSREDFAAVIKRYPECIGNSVDTVKKKTEYLVKEMNWSLEAIVAHPQVLGYSLEKRIVPRCNVIKALMSKGLIGSELASLSSIMARTDDVFVKRYVMKHEKVLPELMAIYKKRL